MSWQTIETLEETYDLDLPRVIERVRAKNASRIGIQLPDGLRPYAPALARLLERETGAEVVVSGEPSFGACDLDLDLARIGVTLLVHFGHSPMPSLGAIGVYDVVFVPVRSKAPVEPVVREAAKHLTGKRVGLLTTAQHSHKLGDAARVLRELGFEPVTAFGDDRLYNAGQLLGCNFTSARAMAKDADCFLYIGTGDFHPIAAAWGMDLPVVVADPVMGEVRTVEHRIEELMRQRWGAIAKAMDARTFAVLVGTRIGQERMKLAVGLKKLLERHDREAVIIALDYFSPDALAPFRHLDAWVNTGCPRITTDDALRYDKPMLTPQELEIVLGKRSWEDYLFDEFKGRRPAPHADPDASAEARGTGAPVRDGQISTV